MVNYLKRAWATVNLDHLAHNLALIRARLRPGCQIMGVVKADAYGHGDRYIAQTMQRLGVTWFGVSGLNEAISLRESGITGEILIFGSTPPAYAAVLSERGITQTVFSPDYAAALSAAAVAAGVSLKVHIKLDTGMTRLGFNGYDAAVAADQVAAACALPGLRAEGIFTHFACSDEAAPEAQAFTRAQFAAFEAVCALLEKRGISFAIRHCCNSGGVIAYPEMQLDLVRPGIISYGLRPSGECRLPGLLPLMELKATVTMVKEVARGRSVSYGRIYTAGQPMRVATVSFGYADGYPRLLSNKGRMIVRGRYAPVVGRVCMDQLMLDVTGIPDAAAGDTVTIVGRDGDAVLTFDEMAEGVGTVNYELICLIGKRVPRVYLQGGREVAVFDLVPVEQ